MSDDRVLGIGVIGVGRMGRRRIALACEHDATELVAISDVSVHAQELATASRCAWASTAEELIARSDVDVVVVSAPNALHLPLVKCALDEGKHVFCEKPLARNVEEAREIVLAASVASTSAKVGANLRFFPNVLRAKELVDEGVLGTPMFARGWIGHEGWNLNGSWFADAALAGGGTFLDNGVHVFDVIRWLLGEVEAGTGLIRQAMHPIAPLEDNGFGLFEFVNGAVAYVQASWTEWAGYMYLELYGTDGYLRIDNRAGVSTLTHGTTAGDSTTEDFSQVGPPSFRREWDTFIDDLLSGRTSAPDAYDGLRAVQMAWSVYDAARTGERQVILSDDDVAFARAVGRPVEIESEAVADVEVAAG